MFTLELTASAYEDLRFLRKSEQQLILNEIERQLVAQPTTPTRNRKPLHPNSLSAWELRVGRYRIFYDVEVADKRVVVKAIGWKEHNRLIIRGKETIL